MTDKERDLIRISRLKAALIALKEKENENTNEKSNQKHKTKLNPSSCDGSDGMVDGGYYFVEGGIRNEGK